MIAEPRGGVSLPAVRACAEIIQQLAAQDPNGFGNLYFAALANVPAGAPFFPAAYHDSAEPAFAFALQAADLAVQAFRSAASLDDARRSLVTAVQQHAARLEQVGKDLERQFGVHFRGLDFTLAPFPEEAHSIGAALEALGLPAFGLPGSLAAAAFLTESLERAAQFQPWRVDLPVEAARYRLQAGDLERLTASLESPEVLAGFGGADWLLLGEQYLAVGELQQAEAAWRQGLQAGGAELELYDRLVSLYLQRGNYPAAVEVLRPTLALQPDEPLRAYRLGLVLSAIQPSEALVYLELAKQEAALAEPAENLQRAIRSAELQAEPAYTYLQAGTQLARLGEWVLAGEAFRQAASLRPDYAEAWALLAEARQQVGGDLPQARLDLERALSLKPDSALVNSLFSLYWERQDEIQKMIACLEAAAGSEPQNPAWQAEWGRALALDGNLQAAQERYQEAVRLAPREALYWRLLAEFSMRHAVNVGEIALPAAQQVLALQPAFQGVFWEWQHAHPGGKAGVRIYF